VGAAAIEEPPPGLIEPGKRAVLLGAAIADVAPDLTAGESALVARAVPKRVRELGAGRALARRALAALGRAPVEILAGSDRAPIWPAGVAGSISHTDDYCAVVVGDLGTLGYVGLDVENRGSVAEDLWPHTFVDEERAFLATEPSVARRDIATVLFSAKEAFYKAQYPITHRLLEFHEVTVRLQNGGFVARSSVDLPVFRGRAFEGAFALTTDRVWTVVCMAPWLDL
jgi:4'-phosphopantetheinyl transferase EntD